MTDPALHAHVRITHAHSEMIVSLTLPLSTCALNTNYDVYRFVASNNYNPAVSQLTTSGAG